MARAGGGLEKLAWRADARPWRLGCSGCNGDGNRRKKMERVVNHVPWWSIYTGQTRSTRCRSFHGTELTATAFVDNLAS
jgi:hypothetical protein